MAAVKPAVSVVGFAVLLAGCAAPVRAELRAEPSPSAVAQASTLSAAKTHEGGCAPDRYNENDLVVCRFDPAVHDIRLFLKNAEGEPYGHFNWVNDALAKSDERLIFAMNAGMYHEDRSPVGLYMESGVVVTPLNTNDGPGNFHLKPNGVFYLTPTPSGGRSAHVAQTARLMAESRLVDAATQSGPMLVIDGNIHPRFLADSDSLKRRNGVGVAEDGKVIFVLADSPIRFYDFAAYFRDILKTPNALYLDGTISRLYAPELERNDPGAKMGPIVGVVEKND